MKQYPLLENKAARGIFGIYLTAMLFLSRDTLVSSCLIGFTKSQVLMFGLIVATATPNDKEEYEAYLRYKERQKKHGKTD